MLIGLPNRNDTSGVLRDDQSESTPLAMEQPEREFDDNDSSEDVKPSLQHSTNANDPYVDAERKTTVLIVFLSSLAKYYILNPVLFHLMYGDI